MGGEEETLGEISLGLLPLLPSAARAPGAEPSDRLWWCDLTPNPTPVCLATPRCPSAFLTFLEVLCSALTCVLEYFLIRWCSRKEKASLFQRVTTPSGHLVGGMRVALLRTHPPGAAQFAKKS